MPSSASVETLHDVIAGTNELIKSLRETIENLKVQVMDSAMLKPSDTHRNLHTRNGDTSQFNIEEAIIATPRLPYNNHKGQMNINKTCPTKRVQSKDA